MAFFTEDVPKCDWVFGKYMIGDPEHCEPFVDLRVAAAWFAYPAKISLNICKKDRNSCRAHMLSQRLKCHCFPCSCRSGDDAVAIHHFRRYNDIVVTLCKDHCFMR